MWDIPAYAGLFAIAFGAATLLPLQSEAVLTGLLLAGEQPVFALLLVATLGNVLGAVLNWWLGRYVERYSHRRWFPASPAQLARGQATYARWGHWSLLLSWLPLGGDALTVIAGVMREPLWRFLLVVTLAKADATCFWQAPCSGSAHPPDHTESH
jgi:membrane protein YqaA with SNARE-associated domain